MENIRKVIYRLSLLLVLTLLLSTLASCNGDSVIDVQMDEAENSMRQHPDTALSILCRIDETQLKTEKEKARYALLMSMALDKNYIDTTSFNVLQPAIDYYLDKGTADEKLKTLYYQGIIFLNRNDYDMAMDCYLKANDLKNECKDILTYANMLVAQGNAYAKSMQIRDYVNNNLRASQLYNSIGEHHRVSKSLIRALDGSISLGDKIRSDSILTVIETFVKQYPDYEEDLARVKMTYAIRFDSDSIINNVLSYIDVINNYDDETKLDLTLAYLKVHDVQKAKTVFESINPQNPGLNTFRYISIKPHVLEENQEYPAALEAYKKFHQTVEGENSKIYSQKTTVAKKLHELQINHLYSLQRKDRQIWMGLCTVLVLIIIICFTYYQLRLFKIKRIVAEQEQSRLQLENENLQKQNSVLELEKQKAELETEKQHLAGENMKLRISQLETENERLKVLSEKDELPDDVKEVIKERIGILNALFAANILDKESAASAYVDLVKREISDKEKFMNSNRLAFKVSHPMFIKYLEDHGLKEYEINYLCLYAIGLKGKEVGNYMELRRHYNISSDIRRKLGIDEHETNIGIYVRKLLKLL